MPSLADHQSNHYVKVLLTGDSGSGKSGALASLVKAGYLLRILDMDNGLDPLKTYVTRECPDAIANVEYRTLRDARKTTAAGVIVEKPRAWIDMMKMLDNWRYDDTDLGKPCNWGAQTIVVIDSLSFAADAAFDWAQSMNPGAKDPRQWFYTAQQQVEAMLALLSSDSFRTNVIVASHVRYSTGDDGRNKGYPNAIGSALGPTIPRYFNHWAQCENKAGKRTIRTAATAMFDLKNTKPFEMKADYDISTGLADFFAVLRPAPAKAIASVGKPTPATPPKTVTLKRV
jgi:hypothetical protein